MSKESLANAEADVANRWENCGKNILMKTSLGFVSGGLAAALFFRTSSSRFAATAFGAGTGFGIGFTECKYNWNGPNKPGCMWDCNKPCDMKFGKLFGKFTSAVKPAAKPAAEETKKPE